MSRRHAASTCRNDSPRRFDITSSAYCVLNISIHLLTLPKAGIFLAHMVHPRHRYADAARAPEDRMRSDRDHLDIVSLIYGCVDIWPCDLQCKTNIKQGLMFASAYYERNAHRCIGIFSTSQSFLALCVHSRCGKYRRVQA